MTHLQLIFLIGEAEAQAEEPCFCKHTEAVGLGTCHNCVLREAIQAARKFIEEGRAL